MKTPCRILFLAALIALPARAAQQITMVMWATNSVSHSNNITFNSTDTRYAVTNITNAAVQWPVTNTAGWVATNLFTHVVAYPPLGFASYGVQWSGTNSSAFWVIAPTGSNITATVVGSWARVTYFTNNYATATNVVVPLAAIANTARSNITSGIIEWLNQNPAASAHVIDALAPAFAKFMNNSSTAQTFTNKSFRNGTNTFTYLAGASGQLSNVGVVNLVVTNLSAPGTGASSQRMGGSALASAAFTLALGEFATASGISATALNSATASGRESFAVGNGDTLASAEGAVALFNGGIASGTNSGALGYYAFAAHTDALVLGSGAESTQDSEITLGTPAYMTRIPGAINLLGTGTVARAVVTNLAVHAGQLTNVGIAASGLTATQATVVTLYATNGRAENLKLITVENLQHMTNSGAILHREATVSSLAAGNNILARGTNNTLYFSGTAGAATICGITNGFGDGDWIEGINGTGYNLTVAHQSEFTTIPQNRIKLVNGASNVTIYPGGMLRLRYSINDSRWLLVYPEVFVSVATNNPTFVEATNIAAAAASAVSNALANIIVTNRSAGVVSGAGSGSTNYLLSISTNSVNDFYLGASNVHLYAVTGGTPGQPVYWTAVVTNLSADTWGISFDSGTNRWRFSGTYGTNAPSVLTNNTALLLSGRSDGTNTLVGYTWFAPGL